MDRMQGEEDVGFQNELTPEQIQQLLAMAQNRMPANMGESMDQRQMMGMPQRFPSPFAPSATPSPSPMPTGMSNVPVDGNLPMKMLQQQLPPSVDKYIAKPAPTPQENINPNDMEALNQLLMQQGAAQGQQPMGQPSPSPFRNIRGTIDRSK